MQRTQRARLAHETVAITESGTYRAPSGREISIRAELDDAKAQAKLYRPEDYENLLARVAALPVVDATTINVSSATTLEAARHLAQQYATVTCLNFASAKNPGGGFLNGSQAQEESLARSSALYATLQTQWEYYAYHRQASSCLYSDHMIFSPQVPVFRNDDGELLKHPWQTSFLTSPAVNAGAVRRNEPENVPQLRPVMERRTRMMLAVAAVHGTDALVLGAWGCGVFGNDPATIAAIFAGALAEPLFAQRFAHIEFAVYDRSPQQETFTAFRKVFAA